MLSKLAIKNAKRSIKDYMIYLITVTLSFSLIFAFNLIIFSKDILELSSFMANFKSSIIVVSTIVVFVVGWLINYTMRFMLTKRSKEFGTYMLLGIEKKQITKMFLLENIILGTISLILSIFLGFILSQFMTMFIMNIFELPYKVSFSFGIQPIILTIVYFLAIYFFVLLRAKRKIKKMKLYDLLYYEKVNENKMYKSKKVRTITFFISILLGIIGLILFHFAMVKILDNSSNPTMLYILLSLISIIISIYGTTLTFADFITNFILKRKNLKYNKDNLFIVRQFTSKVRTTGITLGTLALLITLTFISLNLSNIFNSMFKIQNESSAPYDIMVYNLYSETQSEIGTNSEHKLEEYLKYIKENYTIEDSITYRVYTNEGNPIRKNISNGVVGYQDVDCYLKLSDYNKLLKMRNTDPIKLKEDEFYIHSFRDVSKDLKIYLKNNPDLKINNVTLKLKDITDYKYSTSWSRGSSYIIVVPDKIINENFKIINEITAINTKEETTEEFYNNMKNKFKEKVFVEETDNGYKTYYSINSITVKGAVESENKSLITTLSFCFMYLSFIFIAVVGTILAIQSLSDSTKYKYRYSILNKLGVEKSQIFKTIKKQLILYFSLPMIYPIIISLISSYSLNRLFNPFMESDYSIIGYVIFNIFLFIIIYTIYFLFTYFGFKDNIREETK